VDPAEWEGITATVNELSNRLHRSAKPPRTPGTIFVNATIAMFEMEPGDQDAAAGGSSA
jgi:hypothetical protein